MKITQKAKLIAKQLTAAHEVDGDITLNWMHNVVVHYPPLAMPENLGELTDVGIRNWVGALSEEPLEHLNDICGLHLQEPLPHAICDHILSMSDGDRMAAAQKVANDCPAHLHDIDIFPLVGEEDLDELTWWWRATDCEAKILISKHTRYNPRRYEPDWPCRKVAKKDESIGALNPDDILNVVCLLDHCVYRAQFNEMSKDVEILGTGIFNEEAVLTKLLNIGKHFGWKNKRDLQDLVCEVAHGRRYNPAADWVASVPWDGQDRFEDLMGTLTLEEGFDASLAATYIRRWFIQTVAFLFPLENPHYTLPGGHPLVPGEGLSADGVLVFTGPQGCRKTTWLRSLAPGNMVLTGVSVNPTKKDDVTRIISHWIVELGELDATIRKADIAATKAFITNNKDVFRKSYGYRDATYPRTTSIAATVNDAHFLNDNTGSRRFRVLPVEDMVPPNEAGIDVQQVWAQARDMWQKGERFYMDTEEVARINEVNENFTPTDPVVEAVTRTFNFFEEEVEGTTSRMSMGEIVWEACGDKYRGNLKVDAKNVSSFVKKTYGVTAYRSNGIRWFFTTRKTTNAIGSIDLSNTAWAKENDDVVDE